MAVGDPYATESDLYERLGEDDASRFPDLLDVASRAVEAFTRRQFNKTTSATARRFRPLDWRRLPVDDFHTTTGLIVDVGGTVWDLANVDPHPWNGIMNGQPGWPFYDLIAVNRSWSSSAVITVTAQWGWAEVPAAVRQATADLAVSIGSLTGASFPVRTQSTGPFSVTYELPTSGDDVPPEFTRLLPYRRQRFGVA
jgi:hypothetical protein